MSSPTLAQKLTAEAIGTAILVFIGAGSVPLTVFLTAGAGGPASTARAGLSTISFAFAFAIFAAVYSVGHISGCHINPAVTIALLATRKIDGQTAGGYIVAQLVGAFVGAGLTLIILTGNDPQTLGLGAVSASTPTPASPIGFAAEVIGTAILVFTVFGAAVVGKAPAGFAGIIIGFIVYGIIILVGPITGAALNPARQIGPDILESHRRDAGPVDAAVVVYIVGPIVGGLIGAFLYEFIGRERTPRCPARPSPSTPTAEPDRPASDRHATTGGSPWPRTRPAG